MKTISNIKKGMLQLAAFAFVVVAIALPQQASAVTSGDATIHNAVTVSYKSGTSTLSATANINVTVATIGAAPTITVSTGQIVAAGASVTNTYTVRSNTNGPDTYTPGNAVNTEAATITGTTAGTLGGAFDLWAGHVLSSGANTISVPAGAVTGLVANTSTIELLVSDGTGFVAQKYTVTNIAAGTVASTVNSTGVTTAETAAVLTLSPIGGASAITAGTTSTVAGNIAVGTQVGEYKSFTNVVNAGTPTTPGTDGSIASTVDVVTTAGAITTTSPSVTTTVSSPSVTITKLSRNVTAGDVGFVGSGTKAKPNDVIEYQITVTNTHASASATKVSISDAIPTYTTFKTGAYNGALSDVSITETIGGVAQATTFATGAVDGDVAQKTGAGTGTLLVNIGAGAGDAAGVGTGGTILGSANTENVVILYQVTVD